MTKQQQFIDRQADRIKELEAKLAQVEFENRAVWAAIQDYSKIKQAAVAVLESWKAGYEDMEPLVRVWEDVEFDLPECIDDMPKVQVVTQWACIDCGYCELDQEDNSLFEEYCCLHERGKFKIIDRRSGIDSRCPLLREDE